LSDDDGTEARLWNAYAVARSQFERWPTELGRRRIIKTFTDWVVRFSPDTAQSAIETLRAKLPPMA
jgi:hypothetical protein